MTTMVGVEVSKRALVQRIKRRLLKDGVLLKATRGDGRGRQELGDFYTVDLRRNVVVEVDVDLERMGRDLGVLAAYEQLEDE